MGHPPRNLSTGRVRRGPIATDRCRDGVSSVPARCMAEPPPQSPLIPRDPDEGAASSMAGHIAGARPEDPAGLLIAQAKIADALFGGAATSGLGRFRVLDRL